jgi:hypothetical protein
MQDQVNDLYEQLIFLDEIAGELDEESNARTNAMRAQLIQQIRDIEATI